ncbi:MAG TPA: hypothetical protein VN942_01110 [Chthoniobacterales bacterium]|nr:hypothetical protein [Chthoniobacterales bacterium]
MTRAVSNALSFSCVSGTPFGVYVSFELGAADPRLVIRAKDAARKQRDRKLTKSRIAFCPHLLLNNLFVLSRSDYFAPTPKTLIGASSFLLLAAAIFGGLNIAKVKTLRSATAEATIARAADERSRLQHDKELKARESASVAEQTKLAEREGKTGAAEGQLTQILNEKKQLEAKLQDKEADILTLQKQIEEKQPASANPGAPSSVELQAQLDDARQQLEAAEREKSLLSETVQAVRDRSSQLEDEKKRRAVAHGKIGVRGTVLAVNQAYNFVVLNLGGRNGVERHSEMLIVRDGTFIGKIRISSVEPATAIGDIITSTLARGVQVQPGDIVIYAGTNS